MTTGLVETEIRKRVQAYSSSVLILEYVIPRAGGRRGMDLGIPFNQVDYWGQKKVQESYHPPLHHLFAKSANFNQLTKEKS